MIIMVSLNWVIYQLYSLFLLVRLTMILPISYIVLLSSKVHHFISFHSLYHRSTSTSTHCFGKNGLQSVIYNHYRKYSPLLTQHSCCRSAFTSIDRTWRRCIVWKRWWFVVFIDNARYCKLFDWLMFTRPSTTDFDYFQWI